MRALGGRASRYGCRLDEYDGLARLRAGEGQGRAHNEREHGVYRFYFFRIPDLAEMEAACIISIA